MEMRCPYCRSEDVILWDDGWLCRDCGNEFGEAPSTEPEDEPF